MTNEETRRREAAQKFWDSPEASHLDEIDTCAAYAQAQVLAERKRCEEIAAAIEAEPEKG